MTATLPLRKTTVAADPALKRLSYLTALQDYRVQLLMDNLPAATRMISEQPDGRTITMYIASNRLGFMGAHPNP